MPHFRTLIRKIRLWPRFLWLTFAYKSSQGGPWTSASPWLGTMVGSSFISGAAGNVWLVVTGGLVAGGGVLPVAAAAYWNGVDRAKDAQQEARERQALQLAQLYLQDATALTPLQRAVRVKKLKSVAVSTADFLCETIYADVPNVRAVVFGISEDGLALEVMAQSGRDDPAGDFTKADDRGRQIFDELSGPDPHIFRAGVVGRTYSTFVASPINAGDTAFGMLSVDAPTDGDLEPADGVIVEILSAALGIFFAEAARGHRKR